MKLWDWLEKGGANGKKKGVKEGHMRKVQKPRNNQRVIKKKKMMSYIHKTMMSQTLKGD